MKQRSVGIAILLSIITCGIYGIYWLIMLNDETNYVSGHQQDGTSGGVVFLLTLVTCGIYGYYWCYKQGEKLNEAKMQRGIMIDTSASVIYLVLRQSYGALRLGFDSAYQDQKIVFLRRRALHSCYPARFLK